MNPWRITAATMRIELNHVRVRSKTIISAERTHDGSDDLFLHGSGLEIEQLMVDGVEVDDPTTFLSDGGLRIPIKGVVSTVEYTVNAPTMSPGSSGFVAQPRLLSTQCEPEGFRCLTFFIDEPSNRTVFDVTLVGPPAEYPVMLAAGNKVDEGILDDGRKFVRYLDPVPKPSYLFAMIGGELAEATRTFSTQSGRLQTVTVVALPEFIDGAQFALETMESVMRLDEATLGAEHDLDALVLAAIPEYPDATEYHGLMFFEQSILVVDQRGYVDDDLMVIAANLAHEYGHQVRGNRVTVSTWNDLAVKEGLTVMAQNEFRARQFGEVARVLDVLDLRRLQFPEEVTIGAPVVQSQPGDPRRLYTRTTYLKGSEIFRMLRSVLGDSDWWRAMQTFYAAHDLGSVGVDDFVDHLCSTFPSRADYLRGISRWFRQVGRPQLRIATTPVDISLDSAHKSVEVTVERTDSLNDDPHLEMPLTFGFLSPTGDDVRVQSVDGSVANEHTVMLRGRSATFSFLSESGAVGVVTPLRGYSAPVDLATDHTLEEFGLIARCDRDPYARWWAIEQLKISAIDLHRAGDALGAMSAVEQAVDAVRSAIAGSDDSAFLAQALALPDEYALGDRDEVIDVDGVAAGLEYLRVEMGNALSDDCFALARNILVSGASGTSSSDIARRMPLEPLLSLLLASDRGDARDFVSSCLASENETIAMRGFAQLAHREEVDIETVSAKMYTRWQNSPRLVDRWIRARAGSRRADTVDWVANFVASPMYDRGDRARVTAVWFPFCTRNRSVFHSASGRGYEVFVDELAHLMPSNSGLAVRFVGDLLQFQRFDPSHSAKMRAQLERMTTMEGMPDFAVSILHSLLGTS